MKKVVLHIIPSLQVGGAEKMLVNLVTSSGRFRHIILCLKPRSKNELSIANHRVEIIRPGYHGILSALFFLIVMPLKLRKSPPSVIQGWMYHGSFAAFYLATLLRSSKLIWAIHHFDPRDNTLRPSTRWLIWLLAKLSRYPSAILYCALSASYAHEAIGFNSSKSNVIFNGYDTKRFKPNDQVRRHMRAELCVADHFVVALIGRFHPVKGHGVLLEAFSRLEFGANIKVIFAGRGVDKTDGFAKTVKARSQNSDQFLFLGEITNVPAILNAIDLLVLPSYNEALPNIIAESMASGTCCIATSVGDIPQLIGSQDLLVKPGDVRALSKKIDELFYIWSDDEAQWREQCCRLRQRIKTSYSETRMILNYEEIWCYCEKKTPNL